MSRSTVLRHAATVARVLLGLVFFVFGLNGFLNFLPAPTGMPEAAALFGAALAKTGYMFPMLKGFEVVSGALLLSNRFVPLALALLAPIVLNIALFHLFLAPAGGGPGYMTFVLEVFLAWSYRDAFRPMLAARTKTAHTATEHSRVPAGAVAQ